MMIVFGVATCASDTPAGVGSTDLARPGVSPKTTTSIAAGNSDTSDLSSTVPLADTIDEGPFCPLISAAPLPRSATSRLLDLDLAPEQYLSPLVDVTFDDAGSIEAGAVTQETMSGLVGLELEYLSNHEALSIVEDGELSNLVLRQSFTPSDTGTPVVEFPTVGMQGAEEMWLTYRVFFEPGWEWNRGGKLPGLGGGTNPSGGNGATGTDGFSARLMFRADGRLVAYVYHPDRPGKYGEDFSLCGSFPIGEWIQITERVVMNSDPDLYDGSIEIWVGPDKYLEATNLRLRTTGEFAVDVFVYSSFFGGSDASWSPSETKFARFDDFIVGLSAPTVGFPPTSESAVD